MDITNKKALYNIYTIRKSNGKKRIIFAPCEELKEAQKDLAIKLEERIKTSDFCFGFKKGSNSSDAVKVHESKTWVMTIDICNFFPSITSEKLTSFMTREEIELATFEDRLVQGSPCSPIISNIIFKELDEHIAHLLLRRQIFYTRYADDIAISSYNRVDKKVLIRYFRAILAKHGFKIKYEKIKFMSSKYSQKILGINVNDGSTICSKVRKKLRAAIHQKNITSKELGYLAYIRSVNFNQYKKLVLGTEYDYSM